MCKDSYEGTEIHMYLKFSMMPYDEMACGLAADMILMKWKKEL